MILDTWHVSFTVSEMDRSLAFYRDILGMELIHQQVQQNEYTGKLVGYEDVHLIAAMLRIPAKTPGVSGHVLELIQYVNPQGVKLDTQPCNVGSAHLAFVVDDLLTIYKELKQKGVQFKSEPVAILEGRNKGGYTVYFSDPDQIVLELVQPPTSNTQGE
ncbi:VOC family protein [Cytobacillus purgationiresistens]|uniref:Catechol 2,3-dioxygenase-like lactoylglutathione lyase family enzyme n=1 Tax=Cytobacillus purgationiresistens TaxID=863449 RepID=A0ABU0ANL7_9BACI|nr:VOC family protein [Cytobacillus purgationiresistens]MDQ0272362.1 catechol 2,3-dioxygenase-like lactoylglutathione lyase family enzyme [Cytobacillus purgationiresistens]